MERRLKEAKVVKKGGVGEHFRWTGREKKSCDDVDQNEFHLTTFECNTPKGISRSQLDDNDLERNNAVS
jgi:hypothetical protein